jgi:hypothetical protein
MDDDASSAAQRFRYSVWPGGPVALPEVVPWVGEVDWPWFPIDPRVRSRPRIAAPSDLHVFEFADVVPTRDSLEGFCRTVGLPATRTDRAWADVEVGLAESGERDFYATQITRFASTVGLDVPDLGSEHPHAWHAAELFYRITRVQMYVSTLHALDNGQPISSIWPGEGNGMRAGYSLDPELIAWGIFESFLNAGLAEFQIRVSSQVPPLVERRAPSAYEVACLAVANDLAARAPYRVCANETCRRIFARQRGRANHQQFRTQGVAYCTPQCSRAQSQRTRRRKARQQREKDHG